MPANGGLINNSKPAISVEYADEGIGVSTADSKLYVDEQDVTASAQITSNKTTYAPADPLADGAHKIKLTVMDKAGNASTIQRSFTTRTQPPQDKTAADYLESRIISLTSGRLCITMHVSSRGGAVR